MDSDEPNKLEYTKDLLKNPETALKQEFQTILLYTGTDEGGKPLTPLPDFITSTSSSKPKIRK